MFEWEKLGQVFDPTQLGDGFWMQEYAQAPSVIKFDTHLRVYFSSRAKADNSGMYVSRMGFLDLSYDDLLTPTNLAPAPILPLGKRGTFDEFGTYPVSVTRVDDNIFAFYAGWTRCESVPFNAAIGVAKGNADGSEFNKLGEGPVIPYSPDEPFVMGSPKIRYFDGKWYLWYSAGKKWIKSEGKPEPVYKIRMAVSTDGVNWEKVGQDLLENVLEEDECQASPDVTYYNGKYHMFFSYRHNLSFREPNRGYRVGYAYSDDLINWTRDDKQANFFTSEKGWDSESVSYCHLFTVNDDIYMLYQGNEIGRNGFGLAKLVSYSAGASK